MPKNSFQVPLQLINKVKLVFCSKKKNRETFDSNDLLLKFCFYPKDRKKLNKKSKNPNHLFWNTPYLSICASGSGECCYHPMYCKEPEARASL